MAFVHGAPLHQWAGRRDLGRGRRYYPTQDYLFLIEFARACALAVYKAPGLQDMRDAASIVGDP